MTPQAISRSVWTHPLHFIAFGFGSGLAPLAPGTWGTLMALPFYYLLQDLSIPYYLALCIALGLVGCYICGKTAADIGIHDYGGIVWDEIVGFLLTMLAVPHAFIWCLLGFGLFRCFDIIKPWPIRWVDQQLQGGLGIMFDDVLAAIYAGLLLQLIIFIARLSG